MKILKLALSILFSIVGLVSCNDDDKSLDGFMRYIVTVDNFKSDSISKFIYNDNTVFKLRTPLKYKTKYSRAIIDFSILDGNNSINVNDLHSGEYYISLYRIYDVLTKHPVHIPAENRQKQDSIGNDRVKIFTIWESDGYLNFQFGVKSGTNNIQHLVNLVSATPLEQINTNDVVKLEFRHNRMGDNEYNRIDNYVSFDLRAFKKNQSGTIKFEISWKDLVAGETKTKLIEYRYSDQIH